jgi:hypothetical protein
VVEEELVAAEPPGGVDIEIEHRAAGDVGDAVVVSADGMRWIAAGDGGEVLATVRVTG